MPTPEGLSMKAITKYLNLAHLGRVVRVNTGQTRMGDAPTHPWAKDTRRVVRFGEVGAADLKVELSISDPRIPAQFRGRDLHVEVKCPGWKPPSTPGPEASASARARHAHYLRQSIFLARQRDRGNLALFATGPGDVEGYLQAQGFQQLPHLQGGRRG